MSQDCLEVSPVDVKIDLEICPGISGWNPVSQETGSPQMFSITRRQKIQESVKQLINANGFCLDPDAERGLAESIVNHLWLVLMKRTTTQLSSSTSDLKLFNVMESWPSADRRTQHREHVTDSQWANAFLWLSKQGGSSFDCVLQVLSKMTAEYKKMYVNNLELVEITKTRNQSELNQIGFDQRSREELLLRHQEEMQLLEVTLASSLDELYRKHRQSFRRLTLELYNSVQENSTLNIEAQNFLKQFHDGKVSEDASSSSPLLKELSQMGFDRQQAEVALALSKNNLDAAIIILVEEPERIESELKSREELEPHGSVKSRFLSAKTLVEKSLDEISSGKANIRTISGWLDKAKSKVEDEISSRFVSKVSSSAFNEIFVDTFTVTIGNHVKQTQNLRISNSSLTSFFRNQNMSSQEIIASSAQMNATLYTKKLCAIVLYHHSTSWSHLKSGSAYSDFFLGCQESPEFHFETIERQLDIIEQDLGAEMRDGDVFVTKHSNLASIHLVFHLFVSDKADKKTTFTAGLKNIFRLACEIGLQQLTIPLFISNPANLGAIENSNTITDRKGLLHILGSSQASMPPKQTTSQQPGQFLSPEYILKTCKGFLFENARMYHKQSYRDDHEIASNESPISTLEFLTLSNITKPQFESNRELVCSIFRTI